MKNAQLLKTIGHPVRLHISLILREESDMHVSQIQELLEIKQSLLSHHLIKMKEMGILTFKKKGRHILYSPKDKHNRLPRQHLT